MEYVVFDLETTGFSAERDRIVEIGALRCDASGKVISKYHQMVNPEIPIPPRATEVHGITDADVSSCPHFGLIATDFMAFLGPPHHTSLVGHNSVFDARFLSSHFRYYCGLQVSIGFNVFCTMELASQSPQIAMRTSGRGRVNLDALCEILKIKAPDIGELGKRHRSMGDVYRTRDAWFLMRGPQWEHRLTKRIV